MKRERSSENGAQRTTRGDCDGGRRDRRSAADQAPLVALHQSVGNSGVGKLHENGDLQPKLAVRQQDDPAEREADRVAATVVRMDDPEPGPGVGPVVSRQPTETGAGTVDPETATSLRAATTGGRPLPPDVRSHFETRFDRDLADVRVHTGPGANSAAQSIDAEAFTMGRDIVFASGNYDPGSRDGRRLLAHELTHVLQQNAGVSRRLVQRRSAIPLYDSIEERLSYGAFDWAITDEDARKVLEYLDMLSESQLEAAVAQLQRDELLSRLLDNISEADEQTYYPLIHKIQYLEDQGYQTLSSESMEMLEELDRFLAEEASLFIQTVGYSPWVNLALSNPVETLAGMVGSGSLSPLPGKYAEAVRASKEIVGATVRKKIDMFYLQHSTDLSPAERKFWKGMREIWTP